MEFVDFHEKLKLAYSEVKDGNIDDRFSKPSIVKENRKEIFKQFGVKAYQIIEAQQVHRTLVLTLNQDNSKMWRGHNITGIDGFVTDQTDIALMLRIADCVPMLAYDPDHHAFGLFHIGWRGAVKGLHQIGVEALIDAYDTDVKSLLVWLGPSALGCHFTAEAIPDQIEDASWKPFITKKKSHWQIDIPAYLAASLHNFGIYKKNLTLSSDCTVESDRLFSHQRDQNKTTQGRFAVLAQLK
jgi:hypothetical protein